MCLQGGVRLDVDGVELPPPASRRARSLLAWLALHPGAHPRSEVAALFWPDVLETSARTSLRGALPHLTQGGRRHAHAAVELTHLQPAPALVPGAFRLARRMLHDLAANLVVRPGSLETVIHYKRPIGRVIWTPCSAFHRWLVPRVLRGAAARIGDSGRPTPSPTP